MEHLECSVTDVRTGEQATPRRDETVFSPVEGVVAVAWYKNGARLRVGL